MRTGVLEALLMLIETTPKSIFRHVFAQSEVEGLIEWMMDWAGETQGQVEQRLLAWVLQSIQKQISP